MTELLLTLIVKLGTAAVVASVFYGLVKQGLE